MENEGSVQVFHNLNAFKYEPIFAVVEEFQFDVVKTRLEMEYRVPTEWERLPHILVCGVKASEKAIANLPARADAMLARDTQRRHFHHCPYAEILF